MLVTYPDVAYLSVCELVADDLGLSTRASPRSGLLLSGVAPLRWVLHQFGGGVMLPNWCNPPELASCPLVWSCLRYGDSFPTMSHVILLRLLQTLNLHRWNYNVLSGDRKMTEGNYVRLLGDPACAVTNRCGRQLCETVITFAGERSVSSETDGTIARQKHLFLMPFLRAKASRVSRKRAEVPALVLTVSSRRVVSSFCAKEFALLGLTWM